MLPTSPLSPFALSGRWIPPICRLSIFPSFDAASGARGKVREPGRSDSPSMLLPLAGGRGTVVKFGEFIMILELHRQGLKVAARCAQNGRRHRGEIRDIIPFAAIQPSFTHYDMTQATVAIRPLVSVVTPFYNTARYLVQCIESVLTQSYPEFEYILMDNCSTDGSLEIAESYARRDARIRVIRCSEFVRQLQNYNRALAEISDASQYCKIVQADDYIFPECLELMVQAFQQSNSIGLVSSYRLYGDMIGGAGYPYPTPILPGRECGRFCLRTGIYVFGSQTTVMYRSSLVRAQNPFYNESISYADLEKCMEILTHGDFGFVHQVLSVSRIESKSITSSILDFAPYARDHYIITQRYASVFIEPREAASVRRKSRRVYYRV